MATKAVISSLVILIIFSQCTKVLHFHEVENDKQQEVTIFI